MFRYIIFVTNLQLYTMLRLLSIITFLICICFIESKGDIKNNISLDDAYVLTTDSVWETVFNIWAEDVTQGQARMLNEFGMKADSIWTAVEDGWNAVYATNTAFDTVTVHEISPEGKVGYQFLIWTEE